MEGGREGRGVKGWGMGEGRNIAVSKILHFSETEKLNIAQTCAEVIFTLTIGKISGESRCKEMERKREGHTHLS